MAANGVGKAPTRYAVRIIRRDGLTHWTNFNFNTLDEVTDFLRDCYVPEEVLHVDIDICVTNDLVSRKVW